MPDGVSTAFFYRILPGLLLGAFAQMHLLFEVEDAKDNRMTWRVRALKVAQGQIAAILIGLILNDNIRSTPRLWGVMLAAGITPDVVFNYAPKMLDWFLGRFANGRRNKRD